MPPKPHQKAIPFSLFLRIRRICSTDNFFDQRSREHIEYLTKRGYSRTSLQRDANRVRSITRHATLQPQEQKSAKTDRTPFVTSFNPALPKISSVVNKYTFPNPPVKNATTHAASLVLFYKRVKQTILFLQLTKLEKSPTPYLATQKTSYT